ncbi:hypothetical protein DL770_007310 [Monosporascus sp. CRB-9-2]|nr:hypothetical protein DL770_007310 [Monosporascus sp. CRB-9-2]
MSHHRKRAKKARLRKGPKNPQVWFPDDVTQLLAWLDYCLEHGDNFADTVTSHLKSTRQKLYTWDQIDGKLRLLWRTYGHEVEGAKPGEIKSGEIFEKGTSCLTELSDSLCIHKSIRSSCFFVLFSAEINVPAQLVQFDPSPFTTTTRFFDFIETLKVKLNSKDETRESKKRPIAETSPAPNRRAYERENKAEASSHNGDHVQSNVIPADSLIHPNDIPDAPVDQYIYELVQLRVAMAEKDKQISEQNSRLINKENRIFQLEARLSSIAREFKELQQCLRKSKSSDPEAAIAELQYTESYLKGQLSHIQSFQVDIQGLENGSIGLQDGDIRMRMDILEGRILETCSSLQDRGCYGMTTGEDPTSRTSSLQTLGRRVFGASRANFKADFESKASQLDLLRSLVAASVCITAFESSSALETIDRLAHKSLISETYFETQLLPNISSELAANLAETLSTLSTTDNTSLEYHRIASSDEEIQPLSPVDSFREVFSKALKLKADSLVTGKQFKAVFPPPGVCFDPTSMNKDGWNFDGYEQRAKFNQKRKPETIARGASRGADTEAVKLCLFPAIYCRSMPESGTSLGPVSDMNKSVVDYANFVSPNREDLEGPPWKVISKAVVSI